MRSERRKNVIMWISYALMALVLLVFQMGFMSHYPLFGAVPNIIPVCVASVAVFEGHIAGGIFGMVCGFFLDASGSADVWLYTAALSAGGYAIGMIASYTSRGVLFSCFMWSLALSAAIGLCQFFWYGIIGGSAAEAGKIALVQTLYSSAFALPVRYIAGLIHKKREETGYGRI